jgi:hypothetical protein
MGRGERMQTMTSLGFGPGEITYSGAMNGSVYVWNGIQVPKVLSSHDDSLLSAFDHYYIFNGSPRLVRVCHVH